MGIINISRLAPAKINLDLLITGRREDGYHLLDSLVVFANYGDEITVRPSSQVTLEITGPFRRDLNNDVDNLVLMATRKLQTKFNIKQGAEIRLVKNLPVSSGIGGGSADAAATIHVLMDLWQISDRISELGDLPLSLGADVPACMVSETLHMSGIGEIIQPVSIDCPLYLLLVNPNIAVSTSEIFRMRSREQLSFSKSRKLPDSITSLDQLQTLLRQGGNDLEQFACQVEPVIKLVLANVKVTGGCIYSAMSGSGATCIGLYASCESMNIAADHIRSNFPNWWVQPTQVR